ncbi:hypothetical protein IFM89_037301 [Coptis chinensis]|uniref:DNA-directed RNA polymerase subunit n=1 Tax=Coptis chinensis TaxID=261450 RepID=A0A835I8P5_9MAGN|nr:hypothetical protein IFM89_037301 [Coptis chinensis]
MEVLKVSDANMVVYIHPSKSNEVSEAILKELSSLLFKFSDVFDGVVLAYKVIDRSKDAKILPGVHPYFGVRLRARLLLFSPKPGMLLEGKVNKVEKEKILVTVLGFSSAEISEEDIREEFRYKRKHGKEVYASSYHKRHVIIVGSMIRFSVKRVACEDNLIFSGSLLPPSTGGIKWLDKHMKDGPESERFALRRARRDSSLPVWGACSHHLSTGSCLFCTPNGSGNAKHGFGSDWTKWRKLQ